MHNYPGSSLQSWGHCIADQYQNQSTSPGPFRVIHVESPNILLYARHNLPQVPSGACQASGQLVRDQAGQTRAVLHERCYTSARGCVGGHDRLALLFRVYLLLCSQSWLSETHTPVCTDMEYGYHDIGACGDSHVVGAFGPEGTIPAPGSSWFDSAARNGSGVEVVKSRKRCQQLCAANPKCKFWAWPADRHACWWE